MVKGTFCAELNSAHHQEDWFCDSWDPIMSHHNHSASSFLLQITQNMTAQFPIRYLTASSMSLPGGGSLSVKSSAFTHCYFDGVKKIAIELQ